MGITVDELNNKYGAQNDRWNFSLFPEWLKKHRIPDTAEAPLIKLTLEQILIELNKESLPEKYQDFDQLVLKKAKANLSMYQDLTKNIINDMKEASLKKYDEDWYKKTIPQKLWLVIRGKD